MIASYIANIQVKEAFEHPLLWAMKIAALDKPQREFIMKCLQVQIERQKAEVERLEKHPLGSNIDMEGNYDKRCCRIKDSRL